MLRTLCMLLVAASPALARGERSGEFDYYVMALSWSPNWCEIEGDARGSDQCDARHDFGWILHGLWPQFEDGWPSYCPTNARAPSRTMTGDMTDIMGSSGLAWHQWKKHGVCDGSDAATYYAKSREAYGSITRPQILRDLDRAVTLPAALIEEAFLRDNPDLTADMLTVTCKQGYIQEVRICLTRDLDPRACGRDVRRDCSATDALFTPIR